MTAAYKPQPPASHYLRDLQAVEDLHGGGEAREKEVSTFAKLTNDDIADLKRTLVNGNIPTNRMIIIGRKKFNKRYADDESE